MTINMITKSVEINSALAVSMKTWKSFVKGLQFLCFYNDKADRIVIELIIVPVALRRQGFCGQILNEVADIADLYGVEIWIEPVDFFGLSKPLLGSIYRQYGFEWVDTHWMRKRPYL